MAEKVGFFIIFLFAVSFPGLSQKGLSFGPEPSWISKVPYSEAVGDTSGAGGYYYLLLEKQNHAELSQVFVRNAIKVLSESGLQAVSSINESYDPSYEQLIFHTIFVKRNGTVINKLESKKFEVIQREESLDRNIYDGSLTALLHLEDVQPGDIVEYSYTLKGQNPLFHGKFFRAYYLSFYSPVGKVFYSIKASKNRKLQFKAFNTGKEFQATAAGELVNHEISRENVAGVLSEDASPAWYDPYERIEVSDYQSDEELRTWATNLFDVKDVRLPEIKKKVAEIKSHHNNPEDQINKVIQFVQDEVRYLSLSNGIAAYRPHPPDQVFAQRFGDCKDKSLLLVTMLRELNVESTEVLVNTEIGKSLNDRLPSPWNFNHCIVRMSYGDSIYWIDPTMTLQRGSLKSRYIPSYYHGLIIGTGEPLAKIPFGYHSSNITTLEEYTLNFVGGSAELSVETVYEGDEAASMRSYRSSSSQNEIDNSYLNFYATDHPEITLSKSVEFIDEPELNKLTTKESYHIESYWTYDSAKSQHLVEIYPRTLIGYFKTPRTKIRKSPYSLTYPLNVTQTIKINLPEPWVVSDASNEIKGPGFRYTSKVIYNNKILRLRYSYATTKEYLEAKEVKDHNEKTDKLYDDASFQLTYTNLSSDTSNIVGPFLLIALLCMGVATFLVIRVNQYDPEPRTFFERHNSIGGWLILASIGLVIRPFTLIYGLVKNDYFNDIQWKILADSSFGAYNPIHGAMVLLEMIFTIFILWGSVLVIYLFFKRRTSAPKVIIVLLSSALGFQLFQALGIAYLINSGYDLPAQWAELAKSIFYTSIWVPYFVVSERVKGTFIQRL